jgi:hypothetical protein
VGEERWFSDMDGNHRVMEERIAWLVADEDTEVRFIEPHVLYTADGVCLD